MKLFIPVMAIVVGLLAVCSLRMIRFTTAVIGVALIYGILGLWSISRN
jgi:hypothetical protein